VEISKALGRPVILLKNYTTEAYKTPQIDIVYKSILDKLYSDAKAVTARRRAQKEQRFNLFISVIDYETRNSDNYELPLGSSVKELQEKIMMERKVNKSETKEDKIYGLYSLIDSSNLSEEVNDFEKYPRLENESLHSIFDSQQKPLFLFRPIVVEVTNPLGKPLKFDNVTCNTIFHDIMIDTIPNTFDTKKYGIFNGKIRLDKDDNVLKWLQSEKVQFNTKNLHIRQIPQKVKINYSDGITSSVTEDLTPDLTVGQLFHKLGIKEGTHELLNGDEILDNFDKIILKDIFTKSMDPVVEIKCRKSIDQFEVFYEKDKITFTSNDVGPFHITPNMCADDVINSIKQNFSELQENNSNTYLLYTETGNNHVPNEQNINDWIRTNKKTQFRILTQLENINFKWRNVPCDLPIIDMKDLQKLTFGIFGQRASAQVGAQNCYIGDERQQKKCPLAQVVCPQLKLIHEETPDFMYTLVQARPTVEIHFNQNIRPIQIGEKYTFKNIFDSLQIKNSAEYIIKSSEGEILSDHTELLRPYLEWNPDVSHLILDSPVIDFGNFEIPKSISSPREVQTMNEIILK